MAGFSWQAFLGGASAGHASTLKAAMNKIDRPYQRGSGMVKNLQTGETWVRRGGSWSQIQWPMRRRAGLARQAAAV